MSTQSILLKVLQQVTKLPEKLIDLAALLTCLDFRLQEHREIITRKLGIKERSVWKHYSKLKNLPATHIVDKRVAGLLHVLVEFNESECGCVTALEKILNPKLESVQQTHVFKVMRIKGGNKKSYLVLLLVPFNVVHKVTALFENSKVCYTIPAYTCPWLGFPDMPDENSFLRHVLKREPINPSPIIYEAVRFLDAKPYAYLTEVVSHVEKETNVSVMTIKKLYREASQGFWLGRVMPRWLTPHTPLLIKSSDVMTLHKLISKHLLATVMLVCENEWGMTVVPGTFELMKQPEWRKIDEVYVVDYVELNYLPSWRKLFGPDFKWKRYPRSLKSL